MQTSQNSSAHVCTPPVNAALQLLLQACLTQADATCAVPPDAIVLAGRPQQGHRRRDRGDLITITDGGNTDQFEQKRVCPAVWRGTAVPWHPSYWYAYHTRTDQQGHTWSRGGDVHVTDDFGQLVPVPEAA